MKKMFPLLLTLLLLALSSTVSARDRIHNDQPQQHENNWRGEHADQDGSMPFKWHQHRDRFSPSDHRMHRINDRQFNDRFYGLKAYRWHDAHNRGFWHNGHFIKDAVLFYNDSDELVSFGYMHDGVFIVIQDDDSSFEHHDSFFVSWWNRR